MASTKARAVWLLLFCVACRQKTHGERDTKERSTTTIAATVASTTTTLTPAKPKRDSNVVETTEVALAWTGTIRESTGKAPPVGTTCTLTTPFRVTDANIWSHAFVVTCGTQKLYD